MNIRNEKCYSLLNRKFQVYPFERFDFHHKIDHSKTKVAFFKVSYLCVVIDSLSSWTFHFPVGVIWMIEDKTTKKTKWLFFGLARHTFITHDGYGIIEMVHTLS